MTGFTRTKPDFLSCGKHHFDQMLELRSVVGTAAVLWLAGLAVWIGIARYAGSLASQEQTKAIRLCGWVNIAICIAFPVTFFGTDIFMNGIGPGDLRENLSWAIVLGVLLSVLHSIPGFIVLLCCIVYWKLQTYRVRDNWVLAFTFAAVQAPNIFIMMLWIAAAILDHIKGTSEAILVTWLPPIKLMLITLPVGVLLGLAAFEIARRMGLVGETPSVPQSLRR